MKYKAWGKAKAVLIPHKKHHVTLGVIVFSVSFIAVVALVVRLGLLYSATSFTGEREPYIQSLGSNSVVIRWQSEELVQGRVELYKRNAEVLFTKEESRSKEVHEVSIKGLESATRYYYRLYHNENLYKGGSEYWFETAPVTASNSAVRLWLLGDPGRSGKPIQSVKNAMQTWVNKNPREGYSDLNLIISTGDNAYDHGTNEEYQKNLFSVHNDVFKNYVFWPVYGNRDAKGWSFFNLFSFPAEAELGGVASGTERYYSIDYGQLHLIFLDSNEGAYTANDEMIKWMKKDLEATTQKWIIAFMHHPPYTRGKHNSNDPKDSGGRMFNMRKRVIPVLENAGVDMVVSGHSHSYERSFLIDCHYGLTSDFKESSTLQTGPEFIKPMQRASHSGTIYTVLGSSAEAVSGKLDHPAMAVSEAILGSMIIDVENTKLVARFINNKSEIVDKFVIKKDNVNASIKKENRVCQ